MTASRQLSVSAFLGLALLSIPQLCLAGAGATALANFVSDHIITNALIAFEGVAAIAIFYYGFRMILESNKEEAYTNAQSSFIYAAAGFGIIAISQAFVNAFFLNVNPDLLTPGIISIADFLLSLMSGVLVLMVTIDGLRLVAARGEADARARIFKLIAIHGIGVAIALIAFFAVHAISDNAPGLLIEEMAGMIIFLLTLIGTLCVMSLIAAGIFLIISIDETWRDRAKRVVAGTLITLAVIMVSYTVLITLV